MGGRREVLPFSAGNDAFTTSTPGSGTALTLTTQTAEKADKYVLLLLAWIIWEIKRVEMDVRNILTRSFYA